jgi:DNA-binding transcriptional LysR family regulator
MVYAEAVNLKTFDLNLMLVFDALMRTRNVTLAGENIGLSQSATSNALNRLREAFNDPLFVRTPKGMVPTPLAEELAPSVEAALSQLRVVIDEKRAFDPASAQRTYRILMSDVGQIYFLPRLTAFLRGRAPQINIETVEMQVRQVQEAMAAGYVDLAVGFLEEFGPNFHRQKLFMNDWVCVVSQTHPTIRGAPTEADYLNGVHLSYIPPGGSHVLLDQILDRFFEARKARRRVALRVAHSTGLSGIVAESDLILTVPRALALSYASYSRINVFPLPFATPQIEIVQMWHDRFHRDGGHQWFRRVFAELFREA